MWKHDGSTDHLVGVTRVDTQADMGLDARIESDVAGLAGQFDALGRRVDLADLDELGNFEVFLAVTCNLDLLLSARPDVSGLGPPPGAGFTPANRREVDRPTPIDFEDPANVESSYWPKLADHFDAHASGCALDLGHGGVY
jgi:hypothetical protein